MSPAALPIEEVKDKLLTLDDVRERFSKTEPLESETFDLGGTDVAKWDLEADWNVLEEDGKTVSIEKANGLTPVDAKVRIHGDEYGLTKDAFLEATSLIGITKQYASKTPAHLLQPHLNYWYKNEGGVQGNTLKALSANGIIQAFTKVSVSPFSNLQLLDAVEGSAKEAFGGDTELFVDFKFQHDLRRTACRLIVPNVVHDVRDGDPWSAGLQFKQSVVGEKPLVLSGYLFRYWCTNGAITTHLESGNYNRRKEGQGDEVYDWAREKVDEILGGFEHEFEVLDQLANTPIPAIPQQTEDGSGMTEGEVSRARALMDVFETYGVPLEQRQGIIDTLTDSDDFTMYGIMQAITQVANRSNMRDSIRETLMRVGGDLPAANAGRCQTCRRLPI
jgi:hypothetical protein